MSTLARNETKEMLRYNYTPDERREKGQHLADALNRLSIEEANLDRIKSQFKSSMAAIEEEVTKNKDAVLTGYELRQYICFWSYDDPKPGRKTLRRKEPPQDIVREEEMTIADRQTIMDAIEKEAKEAQDKGINPLGEKLEAAGAESAVVPFKPTVPDIGPEAKAIADGAKAKAAKEKAEARKGRRAPTAGTVDLPSDEGSRDDSGADSKNNL